MDLKPLSVIKKRKIKTLPPHFSKIQINEFELFDFKLENWVINRLNSRYSISKIPHVRDNALKSSTFIGFEDPKELTFFTLACPYYRRTQ